MPDPNEVESDEVVVDDSGAEPTQPAPDPEAKAQPDDPEKRAPAAEPAASTVAEPDAAHPANEDR